MDYHECQWSFHFKNFVFGTSDSQMSCAIGISVMSLCFVSIEILAMSLSALLRLNLNFVGFALLLLNRNFGDAALLRLHWNFGDATLLRLIWNFSDVAFLRLNLIFGNSAL